MATNLVVLRSRIPALVAEAEKRGKLVVQKTVMDIEAGAKLRTPPRVDTGQMMNGWTGEITGSYEGEIATAVEYAEYHEYGTTRISKHPMLIPSAEAARAPFLAAAAQVYR